MNIRRKVSSVGREPVCSLWWVTGGGVERGGGERRGFQSPLSPPVDPPLQHVVTFIINQTDHFLISNQDNKKNLGQTWTALFLKRHITKNKVHNDWTRRIFGVFEHVKLFHAILLVLLLSINRRELCVVFSCPFLCFQKILKMQRNSVTYFTFT